MVGRPTDEPGPSRSRIDLCPHTELLQAAVIRNKGELPEHYRPHKHRPLERHTKGTAEAWIVLRGFVYADVYDERGLNFLTLPLAAEDIFISFRGGHGYQVQPGALVVEVKNGPYYGNAADKEMLDDGGGEASASVHSTTQWQHPRAGDASGTA